MNERISIEKNDQLNILIKAKFDENKHKLLVLWLILWSLAGLGISSQFFVEQEQDMTSYLVVWMGFWGYFEYKVIYAFRWRKYGEEQLTLDKEWMHMEKRIAGRTIPRKFELNWLKKAEFLSDTDNQFIKALGNAYWSVGREQIVMQYKGKDVFIGKELEESEAKNVIKAINAWLAEHKT